jgi:hypothetical protein
MTTDKFLPKSTDTWIWRLAEYEDIPELVTMAVDLYQKELAGLLTPSPAAFSYSLKQAINEQQYQLSREQVIVARNQTTNQLMAYAWCKRGQYTPYSTEEMAEAAIAHVDLRLPTRTRIRILAQILQTWILWAHIHGIPVLVSSSIRSEQEAFMRLHDLFGFQRVGLLAIKRITQDLQ